MSDRCSTSRRTVIVRPPRLAGALLAAILIVAGAVAGGDVAAQVNSASVGGSCPSMGAVPADMTLDELIEVCPPVSCANLRTVSLRASIGPAPESAAAGIVAAEQCGAGGAAPRPPDAPIPDQAILNGRVIVERGWDQPNPGVNRTICAPHYVAEGTIVNGRIAFSSGGFTWTGIIHPNSYIEINNSGVTPPLKDPTAIIGPSDNAVMTNGHCGRGYLRVLAGDMPNRVIENGTYLGQRGYTDPGRRSPGRYCLDRYDFIATVRDGSITFDSDNRSWRGFVDHLQGSISVKGSDAVPPPSQPLRISGSIFSASMYSDYCGNGYFRLQR